MNFSEQSRSQQWAVLSCKGVRFGEVWFKPEGEPFALILRIPQRIFQIPGVAPQLTTEILLKALTIAPDEIESWSHGDVFHSGMNGRNPELRQPLPAPQDVAHLEIFVRLRPPPQAEVRDERQGSEVPLTIWQDLEFRWKALLGLEAAMDTMRINMESLQVEMEASLKKTLSVEDKLHALRADVAQWNKARHRVHHGLPKMREFIHRAIWAAGSPERKQLEELYKNHIQPQIPFPHIDKALEQLETLKKHRQVLSAHGVTIYHECKGISTAVDGALRTLHSNAVVNANKKKGASGSKGKFMKHVRRWSGAE